MSPSEFALRSLTPDDVHARYIHAALGFNEPETEHGLRAERLIAEPERFLGYFDGERMVASAGIFTRDMTVPGGPIPMACVTGVAVHPLYRRRGLLTGLMRRQLDELHETGAEPVAALWASEATIYGRFGYGQAAAMAHVHGERGGMRVRPDAPTDGALRLGDPAETATRADLTQAYEAARVSRPGFCDRRGRWWDYRCDDPEAERGGARPLAAIVHHGQDGPDGYALYHVKPGWSGGRPDSFLSIRELVAATPEAVAALWRYLLDVDLVNRIEWADAPADDALTQLLVNSRTVTVQPRDNLWVRLVDVDRALRARTYAAALNVVIELRDDFCRWNDGRWRVTGGPEGVGVERSDDPADLAMSVAELGALYLGRTVAGSLAASGRIRELRPGALATLHAAMSTPLAPYCPEVF